MLAKAKFVWARQVNMKPIDADALIDTIAIIAKKFAKTDAEKALMGGVRKEE